MAKKVKIYPFPCQFIGAKKTITVNILKLTQTAFMVDSLMQPLRIHDKYLAKFVLPVKGTFIEADVIVYQTFDEFKGKHGLIQAGHHVNVVHFKNPTMDLKKKIHAFLIAIGATKRTVAT